MFNEAQTTILQDLLNRYSEVLADDDEYPELISRIKEALENGANPSITDSTGCQNTLLTLALLQKDKAFAEYLIRNDKSNGVLLNSGPKIEEIKHNTPLVMCIKLGYSDLADLLIEKNVDLQTISPDDLFTPLHFAVATLGSSYRKIDIEIPWVKRRPGFFNAAPPMPLFTPSNQINKEGVKEEQALIINLIEHGADPFARDILGNTPLDYLNSPFSQGEMYSCQSQGEQPVTFGESFGLSKEEAMDFRSKFITPYEWEKDCQEGEKQYPQLAEYYKQFVDYRNKKENLLYESNDTYLFKLNDLKNKYPPEIIDFEARSKFKTAQDIIEDPNYPEINTFEDMKADNRFVMTRYPRGGLGIRSPMQFLPEHLHIFRDFETCCILSRNEYLDTPLHNEFLTQVNEVSNKNRDTSSPTPKT